MVTLCLPDSKDNAVSSSTSIPRFVHKSICNGLILSTCLMCAKVAGSPTAVNLKIAEQSHKCTGGFSTPTLPRA